MVAARPVVRGLGQAHGPRRRRVRRREPRLPDRLLQGRPGLQGLRPEHRLRRRHQRGDAARRRDDRALEPAGAATRACHEARVRRAAALQRSPRAARRPSPTSPRAPTPSSAAPAARPVPASTWPPAGARRPRTSSPPPSPPGDPAMSKPFKGKINVDIRDSVPDWSPFEPPKAPGRGAERDLHRCSTTSGSRRWLLRRPDRDAEHRPDRRTRACATRSGTRRRCARPTRSCLLTGRNHTRNSMACITEAASGFPNASGVIPPENGQIQRDPRRARAGTPTWSASGTCARRPR